ncbi:hypothetical protein VL04_04120 [Chromobacterium violaceum]|nr:hypothetical protein VL02_13390 [Chromobacterium violaceum]KMN91513.1 hypothetical protein VL04_04120 [Chromobacterium violaceum]KMO05697.1 hypothetical protein VL16_00835 [Chromobacterium violaceum]
MQFQALGRAVIMADHIELVVIGPGNDRYDCIVPATYMNVAGNRYQWASRCRFLDLTLVAKAGITTI